MTSAKANRAPAPRRRGLLAWIGRYLRDHRGAVSPIMVLSLVPIIGALGMGAEASNWWLLQRAVQNAADSAAMSASWNGTGSSTGAAGSGSVTSYSTTGCSTSPGAFDCEAVGAAAQAGFVNGSNHVVVFPQYLTSGCPTGSGTTCYKVTITKTVPYYLLGFVLKGGGAQNIQAIAYSGLENSPTAADCLFSPYAPAGTTAITASGTPKANLAGCDIQVNTGNVSCNGNGLQADAIFAGGTITTAGSPCGSVQKANDTHPVTDPYAALDSNIPADNCGGSYPGTTISSTTVFGSTFVSCGNVTLSGNVTVGNETTFYIYNGSLIIPDKDTFASTSGDGVTLVFTGSSTTAGHTIVFGGNKSAMNISAPSDSSDVWDGIAIYQDPRTNTADVGGNNDIALSGNSPFLFTGVLYSPYGNDTFTGTISPSGLSCFIWVFNTLTVKGTANLYSNSQSQCSSAGVTQVFSDTSVHMLVG